MGSTRLMASCALLTALTALGAFIRIPIPPVSCTLQTFFVCMAGMLLPPKAAFLSQGAYVLLGLLGLPIFCAGGGPGYLLNPGFGYLLGFLAAAPLISLARNRFRPARKPAFLLAAAGAVALMELIGVLYMALLASAAGGIDLSAIWRLFWIFLILDLVKLALCVPLCGRIWRRLGGQSL